MSVTKRKFDTYNGNDVTEFTIDNGVIKASVLDFGATLRTLFVADRNGAAADVVCGYDCVGLYASESGYLGATVGRYANRIKNAQFTLDGVTYSLYKNDGNNSLHGGRVGFSHRMWDAEPVGENAVKFTIFSPDGDEGYPADVTASVTYELDGSALRLTYRAESSGKTFVNMTNHSYFNLNGYASGIVLGDLLHVYASKYDALNKELLPFAEPVSVEGTDFDFRTERPIGRPYDDNFYLDKNGFGLAATLYAPESGRFMEVYTDLPAMQLYTASYLAGNPMKGGVPKVKCGAVCLETQISSDTPNRPYMPQYAVTPDHPYDSVTEYVFKVK